MTTAAWALLVVFFAPLMWAVGLRLAIRLLRLYDHREGWMSQIRCVFGPGHDWVPARYVDAKCDRCGTSGFLPPDQLPKRRFWRWAQ